jgi:hypothetical protein
VFFAGCSEEQAALPFDYRVLLTAPAPVLAARLRTRACNSYGRGPGELAQVLADVAAVEPLLRRSADLELATAAATPTELADRVLAAVGGAVGAGVREPVPKAPRRANTVPGHGQGNR